MKNNIKQILISTSIIAFTACGGGGGTSNSTNTNSNGTGNSAGDSSDAGQTSSTGISTKKLIKETAYNEKDAFSATEYTYNSNNLVSKSVTTNYQGDSEEGDITGKTISEYSYEETYNMVKVISKVYNEDNVSIITSTTLQTFSGDKLTRSQSDTINHLNRDNDMSTDGNFTNYQGPIPKNTTLASYDNVKKLTSQLETVTTVSENKDVNATTTVTSYFSFAPTMSSVSSYLRKYDSLDRNIESSLSPRYNIKSTFSYDTKNQMIEPIFACFGGYVQIAKNHRSKYPKAENICYLKSGGTIDTGSKYTYENTISNGLVTKREVKNDDEVTATYTYKYE